MKESRWAVASSALGVVTVLYVALIIAGLARLRKTLLERKITRGETHGTAQ
jgi:hypothetical protein